MDFMKLVSICILLKYLMIKIGMMQLISIV